MILTYSKPYQKEILTITLKKDPFWYGLGNYQDTDGVLWNIRGCIHTGEKPYIQARSINGTHVLDRTDVEACSADYSCVWIPYFVELEEPSLIKVTSAYQHFST